MLQNKPKSRDMPGKILSQHSDLKHLLFHGQIYFRGVYFPENLKNFPTPLRKILKSFPIFAAFFVAPRTFFQVFTPFSNDFFPFSMLFLPHLLFPSLFFCFSYLFYNLYLFFYTFPCEFSPS